jgi:hypothetical protein
MTYHCFGTQRHRDIGQAELNAGRISRAKLGCQNDSYATFTNIK